jgi:hypothetical protein
LTQRSALTIVPPTPVSIVITTLFTPGPKPNAPTTPKTTETPIAMANALLTAGTNRVWSGIASWTLNSVKWMKNRNATVPKNPLNALKFASGIAETCSGFDAATAVTHSIPRLTLAVPSAEMRLTPLKSRTNASPSHAGSVRAIIDAVVNDAACCAGSIEMTVSDTKIMYPTEMPKHVITFRAALARGDRTDVGAESKGVRRSGCEASRRVGIE